jgi:hypothetical protein
MAMLTFDSIPQARVVRKGSQQFAAPRAPRAPRPRREPGYAREQLRDALGIAIGMWPLTCVMALAFGLLYICGMNSAP